LQTGEQLALPEVSEIHRVLVDHVHDLYAFYGEQPGVRIARKHISWYTKALAGSGAFRQAMHQIENAWQQLAAVDAFFGWLAQQDEQLTYREEGLAA
jgi:tRNA-dihydrouridine synthase B